MAKNVQNTDMLTNSNAYNTELMQSGKLYVYQRNMKQGGKILMTAKQYLNQAKTLEYAIKSKQEELYYLTEKSRYIQNTALSERIQSSHSNNSNAIIDKIIDMETEINSEIEHLLDLKAEIRQRIALVYNPVYIAVLTDKYLNFFTLEQIAERMEKDYSTIRRWYGQALQVFRKENHMK